MLGTHVEEHSLGHRELGFGQRADSTKLIQFLDLAQLLGVQRPTVIHLRRFKFTYQLGVRARQRLHQPAPPEVLNGHGCNGATVVPREQTQIRNTDDAIITEFPEGGQDMIQW